MDERAGKPDNINFIHCLCPVIREGEKKKGRGQERSRQLGLVKNTYEQTNIQCFSIGFASEYRFYIGHRLVNQTQNQKSGLSS